MTKSVVYYGSPRQARLDASETLPAKLDLILDKLNVRDRVKGESVAIKLHVGGNIGYSVIHPVFVRKVVQAVRDGGGTPFVVDVNWNIKDAYSRGYTNEVIGCPVLPAAGPDEKYFYSHKRKFKNVEEFNVAGMVEDATFLIDFSHIKGHPCTGFGGAIKNLALGCVTGVTRSAMHDTVHYDTYWFPEKCPDDAAREKIKASCPFNALVDDKDNPKLLHLHADECNACGRCMKVAPAGSLNISQINFDAFQEAVAISAATVLSTFKPGKTTFINLATQITPVCDCFGFTSMPILPDAGIFGSDDIVAIEQATLDRIAQDRLWEEYLPTTMEVHTREGHPFKWLHGPYKDPYTSVKYAEQLGLGSSQYEMVDVLPVLEHVEHKVGYIRAH